MKILFLLPLLFGMARAAPAPTAAAEPDTARELQHLTQALMNAVGEGNKALWDQYLADDCLYIAEDGRVLTKQELLAELQGLPPGYEGSLRVANARVHDYGDTAVMTYDAMETLSVYGQRIDTRFHTTDTWRRLEGAWRLIASQVSVLPGDPTPVSIDPSVYRAYVGRYALSDGIVYAVTATGDELFIQRGEGDKERLLPLDENRFFRRGIRGEIIFVVDDGGVATKLIQRRDNNDIVWRRMGESPSSG